MATLRSPERKSEFRLEVIGYQLLKPVGEDFDDNWLILKMAVETPERRWNGQGPYLTTFEINHLVDSLKAWSADGDREEVLTFTIANLAFAKEASGADLLMLKIGFDLDCNPDPQGQAGNPLWVRFEVTPAEILEFAATLEKEIAAYPERHLTRGSKVYKPKTKA
ncbi:MAG TPA: hypothetical protein VJU16_01725 [Planctomycetota bacterium]|nr:hypothetical protein [Planctomycetota bacterium]